MKLSRQCATGTWQRESEMPSSIGYETPLSQTITSLPLANAGMTEEIVATSYLCVPQPIRLARLCDCVCLHMQRTCMSVRWMLEHYGVHTASNARRFARENLWRASQAPSECARPTHLSTCSAWRVSRVSRACINRAVCQRRLRINDALARPHEVGDGLLHASKVRRMEQSVCNSHPTQS